VAAVSSWASSSPRRDQPVGQTGQGADNLFAANKAAHGDQWSLATGAYSAAKVDYDVAPVPVGASGKPVTLASTVPMVVSAKSKHKAAALTFFAWWLSKTAQEGLAKGSGYPPSRTDMTGDAALTSNPFVPKFAAAPPMPGSICRTRRSSATSTPMTSPPPSTRLPVVPTSRAS